MASQDPKSKDVSREHRLLVKDRGQWKLASQITHATTSLESPMAIENALNSTGYALLEATKLKEAIAVFSVNVRLYPQSWNSYDSLGEATRSRDRKNWPYRTTRSRSN